MSTGRYFGKQDQYGWCGPFKQGGIPPELPYGTRVSDYVKSMSRMNKELSPNASEKEIKLSIIARLMETEPHKWAKADFSISTFNNSGYFTYRSGNLLFNLHKLHNAYILFFDDYEVAGEFQGVLAELWGRLCSYYDIDGTKNDLRSIYNRAFLQK